LSISTPSVTLAAVGGEGTGQATSNRQATSDEGGEKGKHACILTERCPYGSSATLLPAIQHTQPRRNTDGIYDDLSGL